MSKRSNVELDDKLERKEEHDQEQAVVQALVDDNLITVVQDVGQLAHVFRFHPRRFLALLASSKIMQKAIDRAQRDGGAAAVWYKLCLYSFPDYIIQLKAHDYGFLSKTRPVTKGKPKVPIGMPGWCYLFGMEDPYTVIYYENMAMIQTLLQSNASYDNETLPRFCFRYVDHSFTSVSTLGECLKDENTARNTAFLFRLMYPFAIPPAEYCFASQMALHQLSMELLWLLLDSYDAVPATVAQILQLWLRFAVQQKTLYPNVESVGRNVEAQLRCASVQDVRDWRTNKSQNLRCTGDGPEQERKRGRKLIHGNAELSVNNAHVAESAFELLDLVVVLGKFELIWVQHMTTVTDPELIHRLNDTLLHLHALTERAILADVRYAEEGWPPGGFSVRDEGQGEKPFETSHDWKTERATDLELYGSHDPLYWDVLLRDLKGMEEYAWFESLSGNARNALRENNQHAFQFYSPPSEWKDALVDLLRLVGYDKTSEKYLSLSSALPATSLQCRHCRSATPTIAQIKAPFYAYCDTECQRASLISRSVHQQ